MYKCWSCDATGHMNEDEKIIWYNYGSDPDCSHVGAILFECSQKIEFPGAISKPLRCPVCNMLVINRHNHPRLRVITQGEFQGQLSYIDDDVEDEIRTITKGYTIALKQVLTWIENEIGGAQDKMGTLVNQISKELKTLEPE